MLTEFKLALRGVKAATLGLCGGLLLAAGAAMALGHEHLAPWGLAARLERAETARDSAVSLAKSNLEWGRREQARANEEQARRAKESDQATAAQTKADQACDARVAAARRSATAIAKLMEPTDEKDAAGCPVRRLLDADSLRDALGR
jgi:hypothetical protein